MNQEQEDQFIQFIKNTTNGTIGCNENDWKTFTPKVRNALFRHIYEFEFDEEPPKMDVSIVSWKALPDRFINKLQRNLEEYAKAHYESMYGL